MKQRPYIGITGFMKIEETREILGVVPKDSNRDIMIGILVSQRTLKGEQNKWPNRYPKLERLDEIFINHSLAMNLVHYNTKEPKSLYDQLIHITELQILNLDGFQLNICWPIWGQLAAYKKHYDKEIVLQVGHRAFEEVDNSPEKLAARLLLYEDIIDRVLLDPSGGLGKSFDIESAKQYLRIIRDRGFKKGIGVAGGLSPTTLCLIEPLVKEFPDLSIDAESRLRDKDDNLDLDVAKQYLLNALQIFS